MSDIIKKMGDHVPECFFRLGIFLAANMTIPSHHRGAAIQTISFLSQGSVTHL